MYYAATLNWIKIYILPKRFWLWGVTYDDIASWLLCVNGSVCGCVEKRERLIVLVAVRSLMMCARVLSAVNRRHVVRVLVAGKCPRTFRVPVSTILLLRVHSTRSGSRRKPITIRSAGVVIGRLSGRLRLATSPVIGCRHAADVDNVPRDRSWRDDGAVSLTLASSFHRWQRKRIWRRPPAAAEVSSQNRKQSRLSFSLFAPRQYLALSSILRR